MKRRARKMPSLLGPLYFEKKLNEAKAAYEAEEPKTLYSEARLAGYCQGLLEGAIAEWKRERGA